MPFQYKRVLITGATSGIGKALASRIVQEGSSVIVSGRRKENLEAFVHEHGKGKAVAAPFDVTELDKIPNFVTKLVSVRAPRCMRNLLDIVLPKPFQISTASF